jgi:hypothetical protein
VDADDRPVDQRAPAADLVLGPRDRGFGRLGVGRGGRAGALLEGALVGRTVSDVVLRDVRADFAVGGVGTRASRGRDGYDRRDEGGEEVGAASADNPP